LLIFAGIGISIYGQIDHDQDTLVQPLISIDGKNQSVSLLTGNTSDTDPWWNTRYFSVDSLEYGNHTLIVTAANDQPVWLDYLLVKQGPQASGEIPTKTSSSRVSTGTIVGAVIGSVAGLLLLICAALFWWRRRRQSKTTDVVESNGKHSSVAFRLTNRSTSWRLFSRSIGTSGVWPQH